MKQRFLMNVLFLLNVVVNQNIEFGLNKNEVWQFKSNLSYHEKKRQTNKLIKGEKLNLIDLSENTGDFLYSDAVLLKDRSYVLALAVDKGLAIENIELEIVQKDQTSITINGKPLKVDVEEDIGYPTGGGTYIGTECEWLCVPFESLTETLFLYSIEFINPTLDDIQALMLYEGIELMQDSFYSDYEKISGPLISGSVGTYYANVDNPVTVEYLQSLLTAIDETDGDITDKIIIDRTVDTSRIGTYYITYKVSDSKGNVAIKKRNVSVINQPVQAKTGANGQKGVIYLTFDDGPSTSITPKILDILKKKNVKATFFILNYDGAKEEIVKREVNEGHTVAIHGYSHNYKEIYKSEEIYMQNIKKLQDKIKKSTGYNATITRFPGGSSNTVSKYNPGIMSRLTKKVLDNGYKYFDWNISSEDAGDAKTSDDVYENVVSNLSKSRSNVVLMHDFNGNTKTLNALEDIIDYGISNGYTFSKITESTAMVTHSVNN